MRFKITGNKGDTAAIVIRNDDPNSLSILGGAPVTLIGDATSANKGFSAKSVEGRAAAEAGFFAGINLGTGNSPTLALNSYGESLIYGFYDYARVLLSTRAASTDVWASYSAIALGDIMSVVTTSGVQAVQRSGAGSATNLLWNMIAGATLASATTQASSVANGVGNSTAMVTQMRVFVRAL